MLPTLTPIHQSRNVVMAARTENARGRAVPARRTAGTSSLNASASLLSTSCRPPRAQETRPQWAAVTAAPSHARRRFLPTLWSAPQESHTHTYVKKGRGQQVGGRLVGCLDRRLEVALARHPAELMRRRAAPVPPRTPALPTLPHVPFTAACPRRVGGCGRVRPGRGKGRATSTCGAECGRRGQRGGPAERCPSPLVSPRALDTAGAESAWQGSSRSCHDPHS